MNGTKKNDKPLSKTRNIRFPIELYEWIEEEILERKSNFNNIVIDMLEKGRYVVQEEYDWLEDLRIIRENYKEEVLRKRAENLMRLADAKKEDGIIKKTKAKNTRGGPKIVSKEQISSQRSSGEDNRL